MERTKTYLTYEQCQLLLPVKSKRKHRTLTRCSRLYREGASYMVKLTDWRRDPSTGDKAVYDPPVAVIHPHNVAVLNLARAARFGEITVGNLFHKFFGIRCFSKADRRSSARLWWVNVRGPNVSRGDALPFADGLQIDVLTGDAVAGVAEEKRRRVDPEKAKPLRDQIATWDKFASTYFQVLDAWDERHVDMLKAARAQKAPFPPPEEEPSVEGLLRVMAAGRSGRLWWLASRYQPVDNALNVVRSVWKTSFEQWKEVLYLEYGAFTWEPVAKAAA